MFVDPFQWMQLLYGSLAWLWAYFGYAPTFGPPFDPFAWTTLPGTDWIRIYFGY